MSIALSRSLRLPAVVVTALATAAATAVAPTPSTAAVPAPPTVIAKKVFAPLSVAVNDDNVVYYSSNFAGTLYQKRGRKAPKVVFQSKRGREVGAISTKGKATYFVVGAKLMKRNGKGEVSRVAALRTYEKTANPDGDVEYGIPGISEECAAEWPTEEAGPPSYSGIIESHPYGSAVAGKSVYVADAAGNSILRVKGGQVSTAAVLPPVPVELTAEIVAANGMPDCVIGETYRFEGVPTDVEVGPDGLLYVSSLPGGPEDGSAPGSVLVFDPATGDLVDTIVTGLVSAAGVAVAPNGDVYVSELFGNRIMLLPAGGEPEKFVSVAQPSAVEVKGKKLYASIKVLAGFGPGEKPGGKVVRYLR